MRMTLLIALALLLAVTTPTAQQTDPILRVTQQASSVELLRYTPESGVLITREMDPQTVLCIEHQEPLAIKWGSFYTVPTAGPAPAPVMTVPPAPKLPERTCRTIADWLKERP